MEKRGTLIHNGNFKFDNLPDRPEKPTSQEIADIVYPKPQGVVEDTAYEIYSPNERVCGEWQQTVDGVLKKKPLYQKTIFKATQSVTEGSIIYSALNQADTQIKKIDGTYNTTENNNVCVVSSTWAYITSTSVTCATFWQHANGLAVATGQALSDLQIIVKYTKTSDSWITVE